MTVDELKSANTRYFSVLFSLLSMSTVLILWTPVLDGISIWVKSVEQMPGWVYGNLEVIEVALVFFPIIWFSSKFTAKCTECRSILSPQQSELIISTKSCPECGETVLD